MVTGSPLLPALHMALLIYCIYWQTADLTLGLQITFLAKGLKFTRDSPMLDLKDPMCPLWASPPAACLKSYRKSEKNDEFTCLTSFLSQKRLKSEYTGTAIMPWVKIMQTSICFFFL